VIGGRFRDSLRMLRRGLQAILKLCCKKVGASARNSGRVERRLKMRGWIVLYAPKNRNQAAPGFRAHRHVAIHIPNLMTRAKSLGGASIGSGRWPPGKLHRHPELPKLWQRNSGFAGQIAIAFGVAPT